MNGDGTIVTIDQQDARGDFKTIGMPFTMSNFVPDYQRAPKLGEHNREILHALGYDDDQIASLRDSGVIGGNDGVSYVSRFTVTKSACSNGTLEFQRSVTICAS